MKFALVDSDSKVANIIACDQQFVDSIADNWLAVVDLENFPNANIGDIWDGSTFTPQPPDYELQCKIVRAMRNEKLASCDWTQLADSPLDADGKAAWALYRETLRMVPEQTGFPWDVEWPPVPGDN